MRGETHDITLPSNVWRMIRECLATGVYGNDLNDAVATLLRSGLADAIRIGACDIRPKRSTE